MLKKLRALRTNENVLTAVEVLLCSKSSFMNVFLMAFMISISISNSSSGFIVYNIVRYALMGILSILLLPFFRKHMLACWRISMVFSVVEILAVILLDSKATYFPFVLAMCSAMESVLYWRPKTYFDITEIPDERRLYFKGRITIWSQIVKIVMPVVLGVIIGSTGYTRAGFFVLAISLMQLLLSLCFCPTATNEERGPLHHPVDVYSKILQHKTLREVIWLQFVRGTITCSSACLVISQINFYQSLDSSIDLGIFTSLSAILAIISIAIYRRIHRRTLEQGFLAMLAPALIMLPISLIIFPHNMLLSIVFFVFMQGIVDGLYDSAVTQTRIQGILSTHLSDKSFLTEVECYSEVALTLGRVIGLTVLLMMILNGFNNNIMWLAFVQALFILPWLTMVIPKEHRYN